MNVSETIKIPGGLKLEGPSKLNEIKGSGANFSGSIIQKGNTIRIKKSIVLKKRIYQPQDWQSFKESIREFKKPEENLLVLKSGRK